MTDATALDKLIEAVEAGDHNKVCFVMARDGWPGDPWPGDWSSRIDAAYHGSLDAALALHEALLPGWTWKIEAQANLSIAWVACPGEMLLRDHQSSVVSARALLLAILRAYRQQMAD